MNEKTESALSLIKNQVY